MPPIPITIVTGFLGSGKTTLLLNLIPQLPPTYRLALLKNEFGDVAVDSQLASARAISGVQELLNGCICCNLVGQLGDALNTLREDVKPDRIVVETSGSAFPATLAMEVNRVAKETGGAFVLDGVVTVIDVENWKGYEDTSVTARMQARYTDLIVLNKWEAVGERRFDEVLDRVGDLEVETPYVRSEKGWVGKDVMLGIDGALVAKALEEGEDIEGKKWKGHGHDGHDHSHSSEVEVLSVSLTSSSPSDDAAVDVDALSSLLSSAPKDEIYRIKGIVRTDKAPQDSSPSSDSNDSSSRSNGGSTKTYILNWAFGRWTWTAAPALESDDKNAPAARLTFILARYESTKWKGKLEQSGQIKLSGETGGALEVQKIA